MARSGTTPKSAKSQVAARRAARALEARVAKRRAELAKGSGARAKLFKLTFVGPDGATSPHPTNEEQFIELQAHRRAAFAEHAKAIAKASPELSEFAEQMATRYGARVIVWHNVVSWAVAFLIGRYGEAIEHWPDELSDGDRQRLADWQRDPYGELSPGVKPLSADPTAADAIVRSHIAAGRSMALGAGEGE